MRKLEANVESQVQVSGPRVSVWSALADPTRRQILDLLRERPRTTGELADQFPTTRFAIMKHLNILESADLLLDTSSGQREMELLECDPAAALLRPLG